MVLPRLSLKFPQIIVEWVGKFPTTCQEEGNMIVALNYRWPAHHRSMCVVGSGRPKNWGVLWRPEALRDDAPSLNLEALGKYGEVGFPRD